MIVWAAGSGEAAKSGPLALAVILILGIACYFLFRSMSRHMRKVREDFPATDRPPTTTRDSTPPEAAAESDTSEEPPVSPPPGGAGPA